MATDWISRILAIVALLISGGLLVVNIRNRRPAAVISHACFMVELPEDRYGTKRPPVFKATVSSPTPVTLRWARVRRTWRPRSFIETTGYFTPHDSPIGQQFPLTLVAGGKQMFVLYPQAPPSVGERVRIVVKTTSGHRYRSEPFEVREPDYDD